MINIFTNHSIRNISLSIMDFVIWFLILVIMVIAGVIVWTRKNVGKGETEGGVPDLSVEDYSGGDDEDYDDMMRA